MAQWAPWPIKTHSRHAPQNLSWRDVELGCEQFLDWVCDQAEFDRRQNLLRLVFGMPVVLMGEVIP